MSGRHIIVSTMKNEGPYLLEWLAYHRSIGFDDFVIFSNDCTDGTNLILNRLEEMGVLSHFDNPLGPRMDPQRAAYSRAGRMRAVREADWVLIVDADEYLNVHVGDRTVDALVASVPDADAFSLNWRLMGSGGAKTCDFDALITERYTAGSSFEEPENGLVWGFKTLFRPQKFGFFGVHRPKWRKEKVPPPGTVKWVNGDGRELGEHILHKGWRSRPDTVGARLAQVNHYAIKSREDFLLKRLRGTANSKNKGRIDMDYWDRYDLNTVPDATIPTGGIRAIMDEWLADPELAALMRACHLCARKVLTYQLEVPEFRTFVETGVFPRPPEEAEEEESEGEDAA